MNTEFWTFGSDLSALFAWTLLTAALTLRLGLSISIFQQTQRRVWLRLSKWLAGNGLAFVAISLVMSSMADSFPLSPRVWAITGAATALLTVLAVAARHPSKRISRSWPSAESRIDVDRQPLSELPASSDNRDPLPELAHAE